MSERWQIKMLGGLQAVCGTAVVTGLGTGKRAALLAYLATQERGVPVSREVLAERFWPELTADGEIEKARHCLSVELNRLGHALEANQRGGSTLPALLVIGGKTTVALVPDAYETDVAQFETAAWKARRAEGAAAIPSLLKALELYSGAFLAHQGKSDAPLLWVASMRHRLHTMFGDIVNRLVPLLEARGGPDLALAPALRLAQDDSGDVEAQAQALRLAAQSGQHTTAAALLAHARSALDADTVQDLLHRPALALSASQIADLLKHGDSGNRSQTSSKKAAQAARGAKTADRIVALPPELRELLCALSRFQSAFTLAEAEAFSVAGIAPYLETLVAQKWVTVAPDGYTLSHPVRAAAQNLLEKEARHALCGRHARFCLERAQAAEAEWTTRRAGGPEQTRLKAMAADVALALEWSMEQSGKTLGVALVSAMVPLWTESRQFETVRQWTERARRHGKTARLEPTERYALLRAQALAARDAGDWEGAEHWYSQYLQYATRQSAPASLVAGLIHLGIDAHHAERDALAQKAFASCLPLAERHGLDEAVINTQMNWATSLYVTGQIEEAETRFEAALTRARDVPNTLLRAEVLGQMGELWMRQGRFDAARALFNESLELRIDLDASTVLAECWRRLGALCCEQNHLAEATAWMRQSEAVYARMGDAPSRAAVWGYYGDIALRRGQMDEARRWYGQGLAVWEAHKHDRWQALFLARRARAAWLDGDAGGAQTDCERALPLCEGSRALSSRAFCLRILAHLALNDDSPGEAVNHAGAAQAAAAHGGHWRCHIELLETGTALCVAQGEWERALTLYAAAQTYRCAANAPGVTVENALYVQACRQAQSMLSTARAKAACERGREAAHSLPPAQCAAALH